MIFVIENYINMLNRADAKKIEIMPDRKAGIRGGGEMKLDQFIGKNQLSVIKSACKGEESEYFMKMVRSLITQIETMPKTYETDGQGDNVIATLHYFNGGSDWYIIEKDAGSSDDEIQGIQQQAFGFVCLNGDTDNAELGYISIQELIENGVELDLYYKPETLKIIKSKFFKEVRR